MKIIESRVLAGSWMVAFLVAACSSSSTDNPSADSGAAAVGGEQSGAGGSTGTTSPNQGAGGANSPGQGGGLAPSGTGGAKAPSGNDSGGSALPKGGNTPAGGNAVGGGNKPAGGNTSAGGSTSGGGSAVPQTVGGQVTPTGGESPPSNVWQGGSQTVCSRTVPESVAPSISCTPAQVGKGYDGCSGANQGCGSLSGCPLERNEAIDGTVDTTYTPPVASFQPPATLLPSMGTTINGYASGWFARGDGTAATGSCGLPPVRNIMVTAISMKQFGNADWCGTCAEVVGRSGRRVRVEIIDQCTGCPENWIDMGAGTDSPFNMLDVSNPPVCTQANGEQPVAWKVVPCETQGGIVVHYTEGFNNYTPALQLRNYRLSVVKLEDQVKGTWATVERQAHNQYYIHSPGDGKPFPVTLRITAIDGSTITGTFPSYAENKNYEATSQF